MLGNCACFLWSATFVKIIYILKKNYFRKTIRVSNSFDPDQAQRFVEHDLGQNCLQRLSADDTYRHLKRF